MRHPSDGVLRRLVDDPAGVADADRDHVPGCTVCSSAWARAGTDAAAVSARLDTAPMAAEPVDVSAGWARLTAALDDPTSPPVPFRSARRQPSARLLHRVRRPIEQRAISGISPLSCDG